MIQMLMEGPLGGQGILASSVLCHPLRDHDPVETMPEQPEVRLHATPAQ